MNSQFQEFNNALHCKAVGNRHISHTEKTTKMVYPPEKGVGISGQTMCAFSLGPSHPTSRNPLEIRKHHLHEVMHCWGTLLKVDHDSQHKYNTPDSSIKTEAYSKIIYKIMELMYLSR